MSFVWTLRNSAVANNWTSISYGNGLFVVVANSGVGNRVMTSPDGIDWTSRTSAADNNWLSVTYGNGLFVAVANSGVGNRVMTSPDGITWTSRVSAADNAWFSVTYGNRLFVAVASSGVGNRVMTSPDGITWTSRVSASDNNWRAITYGNGLFVAVAGSGTGNRVMTSPDGITWTSRVSAADNNWSGIEYGNGMFIAVAKASSIVMKSSDGITWSSVTFSPIYLDTYAIRYDTSSTQFIVLPNNVYSNTVGYTTSDGINFQSFTPPEMLDWRSVICNNGTIVAVSNTSRINNIMTTNLITPTPTPTPTVIVSPSLWVSRTAGFNHYNSIAYGNGKFVAVGGADSAISNILISSDGINWSTSTIAYGKYTRVIFANNMFVTVSLPSSSTYAKIFTSTDGVTWTVRHTSSTNNQGWWGLTYGNGKFVALSSNLLSVSSDGITWRNISGMPSGGWFNAVYGNGLFVAVGAFQTNIVMVSVDGEQWSLVNIGTSYNLVDIIYGNGLFVAAVSYPGGFLTSPDGYNWTLRISQNLTLVDVWGIIYVDGLFIACGYNHITVSSDGIVWTSFDAGLPGLEQLKARWRSVTYGNGMLVAVADNNLGANNSIITSNFIKPTISNFSIPRKILGDPPFTITDPTSNSTGIFSYISSDSNVVSISNNIVTIISAGQATITAIQAATTNYPSISTTTTVISDICFVAGSSVKTDQGFVNIEQIIPHKNTINNKPILLVTKTISIEKYLVSIDKHSFGYNIPNKTTIVSRKHKMMYKNKFWEPWELVDKVKGVKLIEYNDEPLYNVLMEQHTIMDVNNIITETLDPKSRISKEVFSEYISNPNKNIQNK